MENKKEMHIVLAILICAVFVGAVAFISIKNKINMTSNDNLNINNTPVASNTGTSSGANASANNTAAPSTPSSSTDVAKVGDTVAVNYTGRLANGTVFDSNVDPKFNHVTPFIFTLGAGQVIPGWDKGIVGMKIGEKKTLVIPPEDAYGAAGAGGVIPPNATLTFDVELLAIKK